MSDFVHFEVKEIFTIKVRSSHFHLSIPRVHGWVGYVERAVVLIVTDADSYSTINQSE